MPMNMYVAPYQQSGSPNVPITESTGGQLQGSEGNLGNIENSAFSGTVLSFPEVISNAVIVSGNLTVGNQTILNTAFQSGTSTAGLVITGNLLQSGGTIVGGLSGQVAPGGVFASGYTYSAGLATNSGQNFNPAGFILFNVPTSGSPWVKVPFFNS